MVKEKTILAKITLLFHLHNNNLQWIRIISDPSMVDNPDIPSFQPHIHGKCVPSALIPLHMKQISMEIHCSLDTAFVTIVGVWRVHCVKRNRSCFCRLIVPMTEQGSVLGVEVDVNGRQYTTQLIPIKENMDTGKLAKSHRGGFLTPQMFATTIPQVEGGSNILVKINWSQKLSFNSGQFSLSIPFKFPEFVIPPGKGDSKIDKIMLNVESGTGAEVLGLKASYPLKIVRKQVGRLECSYEADVSTWSQTKFKFSYAISCAMVSKSDILGGLLLHSPSKQDLDKREMFCFYLYPGNNQSKKVFRKEVVFLIDISGSMQGRPLQSVKDALLAALRKLNQEDSFSLIAFSGETFLFSSTLQLATTDTIEKATQWMQTFVAAGGTNILQPLSQAMEMLSNVFDSDSIPHIFLITDGSVENEKHICELIRNQVTTKGSRFPRISTFGIGTHCNHYFLQMLALISKGHYGAALHPDHIEIQFQRLFTTASSTVLANIVVDELNHLDAIEVYPRYIPDLSSGNPLIVSGRYKGEFPDSLKISGFLSDVSNFTINLKPQRAKGIIALERVVAKKQIDLLTAQAWLSQSKELEEKVAQISIQSSVPSEYTRMILCQTEREIQAFESVGLQEVHRVNLEKLVDSKGRKIILLRSLGYGFGSIKATAENVFPRFGDPLFPDSASDPITKAASTFCAQYCHCCCCMCLIRTCSHVNNQCAVVLSQFITALTCFGCLECCVDLCCDF